MEGVTSVPSSASISGHLKIPYLSAATYQPHGSFYEFAAYHGVIQSEEPTDLTRRFETINSLASFMQSWLFFEHLAAFLGFPVDHSDFITEEGFVSLHQITAYNHFRRWKGRLWQLSFAKKQQARQKIEDLICFTLSKSDIFEEAAELLRQQEDSDFDSVALSVKLLVCLLSAVVEDTFSVSFGWWPSWMYTAFARLKGEGTMYITQDPLEIREHYLANLRAGKRELKHLYNERRAIVPLPPGDNEGGRATTRLILLLENNGWCPFRARQLCQNYDYLTVNNIAAVKRPLATVENHQSCIRMRRCTAHDLNVRSSSTYPFRHDCDEPCSFEGFSYDAVAHIIQSGGIPVVSVNKEGPLEPHIDQCTPQTTYTAISHVWSDGLGNPSSNALPGCQLKRLRELIRQTYIPEASPLYDESDPVWSATQWEISKQLRARPYTCFHPDRIFFWMDTLCIPVRPDGFQTDESRELRFRAIKQITPIFAGAFNTLVLDSGLQAAENIDPKKIGGDEFAALVLGSKWMERGWTLEEGCLSQSCVFQLLGKPYDMATTSNHLTPIVSPLQSPLERVLVQTRQSPVTLLRKALRDSKKYVWTEPLILRAKRLTNKLRVPQFVWTWNSLISRSTTKSEDGILILANLLDFSIYSLRCIPKGNRLMTVIQSCNELPLSLLYNTGPRMIVDGCPELALIPRDVLGGDNLVLGGIMHKIISKTPAQPLQYAIQRPKDASREQLLVLKSAPGQSIPGGMTVFRVHILTEGNNGSANNEYVIEMQTSSTSIIHEDFIQSDDLSLETYLFIDLAYGTRRRGGFAGRGARFLVDKQDRTRVSLKYKAPLVAWTLEQWYHKVRQPEDPIICFRVLVVPPAQKLVLNCGMSISSE
jgi:hypothetical protein